MMFGWVDQRLACIALAVGRGDCFVNDHPSGAAPEKLGGFVIAEAASLTITGFTTSPNVDLLVSSTRLD